MRFRYAPHVDQYVLLNPEGMPQTADWHAEAKRWYPGRSDFEFSQLIKSLGVVISFTKFEAPKSSSPYQGRIASDFNHPPLIPVTVNSSLFMDNLCKMHIKRPIVIVCILRS